MIRSRVAQVGGVARLTVALYHHFSRYHTSRGIDGSSPSNISTSDPAVSTICLLSPFRLAVIAPLSLRIWVWSFAGFCHTETLLLMSLHVSSDIHPFFLLSCACSFGTALCRSAKIPSYCLGEDGVWRGSRLRPVRYCLCALSGALQRQPITI